MHIDPSMSEMMPTVDAGLSSAEGKRRRYESLGHAPIGSVPHPQLGEGGISTFYRQPRQGKARLCSLPAIAHHALINFQI